jgi:hypothetical protein
MTPILMILAMAASAPQAPLPLQPMTYREGELMHTLGTGCSWHRKGDRPRTWRLAMHKDRGAIKIDGRLVAIRPAKDAKDLFPFTYDRWMDDRGDVISVRETGKSRQLGTEAFETPSELTITNAGTTTSWTGVLNCGS